MDYEKELATGTFHIRLHQYLRMYASEQELAEMAEDNVLHFDMETGAYTISYEDLKKKSDEETLKFLDKHNIDLKNTK